jgi:hypothetical protein
MILPEYESPIRRILGTANQLNEFYNNYLGTKSKEIQNQLAAPLGQAEVMSKSSYAQYAPAQSIATILSNPQITSMLTPDQYKEMANIASNIFSQSPSYENILSKPSPTPRADNMLTRLVDTITGREKERKNQLLTFPQQVQEGISQVKEQPSIPSQISPASAISPNQIIQSPTLNKAAESTLIPGTMGGISPPNVTEAQKEALKAAGVTEAKLTSEQTLEEQKEAANVALESQNMLDQLNIMQQSYPTIKSGEKGALSTARFGFKGVSDAAQAFDTAATNLVAAKLKAWQAGRITNFDIPLGQMMKPSREMNEKTFNDRMNYERGFAMRNQEYLPFSEYASRLNLSPTQKNIMWMRYINENPFYNQKSGKVNYDNLGNWGDYLTSDKIVETLSPQFAKKLSQYQRNMYGSDAEKDQELLSKANESLNTNKIGKARPQSELKGQGVPVNLYGFNNKKEFQDWYANQSPEVKESVRNQLSRRR